MMRRCSRVFNRAIRLALMTMLAGIGAGTARAQSPGGSNTGALTFTGGFDVPSRFVFRGFVQEREPKLTLWPYGDIDMSLASGNGGIKTVDVSFGVWNSLQTGSSGLEGPSRRLHYWEDFYAALSLGLGGGMKVQGAFTAHTSPNAMFTTNKEISVKASHGDMWAPHAMVVFELDDRGQADMGLKKGTYLELGAAPHWQVGTGTATFTVPIKLGMSLNNYYEGATGDETFGFFDAGGLITLPLSGRQSRFGSWNIHGGADVLVFGDTTKAFNAGDKSQVVGLVGIGVTY
jgi:hypothetical protein